MGCGKMPLVYRGTCRLRISSVWGRIAGFPVEETNSCKENQVLTITAAISTCRFNDIFTSSFSTVGITKSISANCD